MAPIRDGFRVQGLGTPEEAATRFLENPVAPDGSGRTATLLASGSRCACLPACWSALQRLQPRARGGLQPAHCGRELADAPGSVRLAEDPVPRRRLRRTDAADNLYYWMEFLVEGPGRGGTTFRRHNVSSYVACNGLLYTFTCQCTEGADWERDGAALREAARSFRPINSGAAAAGFPGRL